MSPGVLDNDPADDGRPEGLGTPRRRRSDAALNRAKIIDAARRLLQDKGELNMRAVASSAGLGRGTVHRHFATREELLGAVRQQARDDADSDEENYLRAPGELARVTGGPLSITDVLNKVPPFQLGEQIIAEAQRLPGVSSAALYVVDLNGSTMQRLAGSSAFPAQITVPLAIGTEIPREGVAAIHAVFADLLPGASVAPLHLRGRAIGILLAVGNIGDALRDLASEAAVALTLAPHYTDHIDTVRRTRPTSPAAEIQQNLLPPRIVRIGGATVAGNVLPGYEIGGDWFDYAENPQGTWIGIADSAGSGATAAGVGAITLGAFRSARRNSNNPAEILHAMHQVLLETQLGAATSTATIGLWNAPASTFHWATSGPQPPMLITRHGTLDAVDGSLVGNLGTDEFPGHIEVNHRLLRKGERLLLLSDGITGKPRSAGLGLDGVAAAAAKSADTSAPATVRAIEDALREITPGDLDDDATIVVLAPSGMTGPQQ